MCRKVSIFDDSSLLLQAMAEADIDSLRNTVFIEEKYVSDTTFKQLALGAPRDSVDYYAIRSIARYRKYQCSDKIVGNGVPFDVYRKHRKGIL